MNKTFFTKTPKKLQVNATLQFILIVTNYNECIK